MQQENYNIVVLRDLIKQKHDQAENHAFVKTLFAGKLPTKVYVEFLYNQLYIYRALEVTATNAGAPGAALAVTQSTPQAVRLMK